jgi:hypothetical protein
MKWHTLKSAAPTPETPLLCCAAGIIFFKKIDIAAGLRAQKSLRSKTKALYNGQ